MTGAFLVIILAVASAVAVLVAVLANQRPDEGWIASFRESYRAWRSDELTWADTDIEDDEVGGLGALYLMSEPGSAYTSAEEISGTFSRRRGSLAAPAHGGPPASSDRDDSTVAHGAPATT